MTTLFFLIILFFSIAFHELSHGRVANLLGDPTAKYAGRLTLNPLKHLDPFGSVILPILLLILTQGQGPIFGWAKPVPVNPYNFKNPRWDNAKVALAGPLSNFLLALIFGLLIRFFPLPLPLLSLFSIIVILNLLLALFNLLPLPPLDGSHLLFALLEKRGNNIRLFLEQYGIFILIFFLFLGLSWLFKAVFLLYYLITGLPF